MIEDHEHARLIMESQLPTFREWLESGQARTIEELGEAHQRRLARLARETAHSQELLDAMRRGLANQ